MPKITLICSAHRENGFCNAHELLNILGSIQPEVIFCEMRPTEFDYHLKNGGIEANAIARYREAKAFQLVEVDRYDAPMNVLLELKKDFDRVLEFVTETSTEYERLNQENFYRVQRHGFRYLNSGDCARTLEKIAEIEESTIAETGNQDLARALSQWRSFMRSRELEMLRNIYLYCAENAFGVGVFLLGAAHKINVVNTVGSSVGSKANQIDWKFIDDGDRLCS